VGLYRRSVESVETRITEISGRQRNDERKHDHAHEPPMPPERRTSRNVCTRFPHDNLKHDYTDQATESNVTDIDVIAYRQRRKSTKRIKNSMESCWGVESL
jgi:hypothetical protein